MDIPPARILIVEQIEEDGHQLAPAARQSLKFVKVMRDTFNVSFRVSCK